MENNECRFIHNKHTGGKPGTKCTRLEQDHCHASYCDIDDPDVHDDDCYKLAKVHHPFHRTKPTT